jgi:hypothetical protein
MPHLFAGFAIGNAAAREFAPFPVRKSFGTSVAMCPLMGVKSSASLLGLLVLTVIAPAAHAHALLEASHMAIYDATGKQVGSPWPRALGSAGNGERLFGLVYTAFRLGDTPVIVRLYTNRFHYDLVQFAQRGCTGQAMLQTDWEGLYPLTAVAGASATLYRQSGPLRARTIRSTLTTPGGCIDHNVPYSADTVALKATTLNLADHFVPPFTTQTRGRRPIAPATP